MCQPNVIAAALDRSEQRDSDAHRIRIPRVFPLHPRPTHGTMVMTTRTTPFRWSQSQPASGHRGGREMGASQDGSARRARENGTPSFSCLFGFRVQCDLFPLSPPCRLTTT